MNIGLRFKLFRTTAGMSQREVADKLGVTVNFLSMIERGRRNPTVRFLQEFADVVQVPAAALLWEPSSGTGETAELQQRLQALIVEYARVVGVKT